MNYVKGHITKILFESSTGYKVGLFRVKEALGSNEEEYINKTITVTGMFDNINTEMTYKLYGNMVNHPRFGIQYNVVSYEFVAPTTEEGLITYLSSPNFKGIGVKTATLIVKEFGKSTIEEIKNNNPKLSKIKGMNEKKAKKLSEQLVNYDKDQELILEFNKLGFTTEECFRIVNKYSIKLFDIMENNIYLLKNDIKFNKLDAVFLMNHKEDDIVRIKELVLYLINELCYSNGDTLVNIESLYIEINKYFKSRIDSKVFMNTINDFISSGVVIKSGEYITTLDYYETEERIASRIKYLNSIKESIDLDVIKEEISNFEVKNDIKFNSSQMEAIIGSLSNNIFVITGGPGTGKTTIVKAVVDIYSKINKCSDKDITLLAPTGKASKRLSESVGKSASTIHKFLKWDKESKEFGINRFNKVDTKLVIIDETSMVDIFLLDSLFDGLNKNIKLILVGDKNQLPSIKPGDVLRDLVSLDVINKVSLNTIYRTKSDSYIIPFANLIKDKKEFESIKSYDDFSFIESSDYYIKKCVTDICNKVVSKGISIEDFQVLVPMYKGENGIDNINILMQSIFNRESSSKGEIIIGGVIYREGDKVIQLVNDVDNNVFNGDIGYIRNIYTGKDASIEISFNGHWVNYNKESFDSFTHAYAISVHKSQGSEYDHILLIIASNMKRMLYNKLLYTGVTRAKKSLIVLGSLDSLNLAIRTTDNDNRITSLKGFFNK